MTLHLPRSLCQAKGVRSDEAGSPAAAAAAAADCMMHNKGACLGPAAVRRWRHAGAGLAPRRPAQERRQAAAAAAALCQTPLPAQPARLRNTSRHIRRWCMPCRNRQDRLTKMASSADLAWENTVHSMWEQALLVSGVTRRTASIALVVGEEADDARRWRSRAAVISTRLAAHAIASLRVGV